MFESGQLYAAQLVAATGEIGGRDGVAGGGVQEGPSVNSASSPQLSMTAAELGDASPPAKTQ